MEPGAVTIEDLIDSEGIRTAVGKEKSENEKSEIKIV
jgi:hypothetical protein